MNQRFEICDVCKGLVAWQDCPTGGWWIHEIHPEDGHDAVVEDLSE